MSKRHTYRVTLSAAAGQSEEQAVRSLRACLKMALRSYGLRCTDLEPYGNGEVTAQDAPQSTPIVESDK